VPEYFEGGCTMHSCETYAIFHFPCERDNPSQGHSTTQIVVGVYFLRTDTKLSIYDLTS
jgi:hypothetical protein